MSLTRRGLLKFFGITALSTQIVETKSNSEPWELTDTTNGTIEYTVSDNIISVHAPGFHVTRGIQPITLVVKNDALINGDIKVRKGETITLYPLKKGKWDLI